MADHVVRVEDGVDQDEPVEDPARWRLLRDVCDPSVRVAFSVEAEKIRVLRDEDPGRFHRTCDVGHVAAAQAPSLGHRLDVDPALAEGPADEPANVLVETEPNGPAHAASLDRRRAAEIRDGTDSRRDAADAASSAVWVSTASRWSK